jgi:hypothetical protein
MPQFAGILQALETLANYLSAFTRQRSLVRTQHCPLHIAELPMPVYAGVRKALMAGRPKVHRLAPALPLLGFSTAIHLFQGILHRRERSLFVAALDPSTPVLTTHLYQTRSNQTPNVKNVMTIIANKIVGQYEISAHILSYSRNNLRSGRATSSTELIATARMTTYVRR